jgi:hypothetical protein
MLLRFLTTTARVAGILLGCLVFISSALDILGALPHSNETPPLTHRLKHQLSFLILSPALVVPYRRVTAPVVRWVVLGALTVIAVRAVYLTVTGWQDYVVGQKSWDVVPASIFLCAVVAGNIYAFSSLAPRTRKVQRAVAADPPPRAA